MRISNTDVSLQYSTVFLDKVESVINMNVDKDVSLVALFTLLMILSGPWGPADSSPDSLGSNPSADLARNKLYITPQPIMASRRTITM